MKVKVVEELKNSDARGQYAGQIGTVVETLKSCKAVKFPSGHIIKFYHQHLKQIS
jgi:ribosomal protein L21E